MALLPALPDPATALQGGFMVLPLFAGLYEPVRLGLYRLGEKVGGVGGVGGLTNQWDCLGDVGAFGEDVCFHRGAFAGLTPFALFVLGLWVLPLALSALYASLSHEPPPAHEAAGFLWVWSGLELLWFAVPVAYYMSDPFYQENTYTVLLGLSLASAMPLSWNLSVVAIPGLARAMEVLTGLSRPASMRIHKSIAWSAVRWATLHAVGELAYTCINPDGDCSDTFLTGSYRYLFWFGAVSTGVLAVHVGVVAFRHRLTEHFLHLHRSIAAVLLICATIHWWPFIFFLCPAAAVYATTRAMDRAGPGTETIAVAGRALGAALLACLVGVCAVWQVRQVALAGTHDKLPVLPFIFAPLGLVLGFFLARLAAAATVAVAGPSQLLDGEHDKHGGASSGFGYEPLNHGQGARVLGHAASDSI